MSELTKEQIKGPDKFQKFSSEVVRWVQKNRKAVNIVLAILLVGGLAYAGYDFMNEKHEGKARLSLYTAQKIRQDLKEKQEDKKKQESEGTDKKDKKEKADDKQAKATPAPAPVDPAQIEQLKKDAIAAYQKVIQDYPGTAASHIAALHASQMLIDESRIDEAGQVLEKSKEPSKRQSVLLGAYLNQRGKVMAQKGDCQGAVKSWEKVYTDPNLTVWHADSLVKAAICYEKLQQKDKAIELYKKASSEQGETDAGRTAKKLLILTENSDSKGT
jgi:predicted negative regulator of RcsB-dependent stress response